MCLLLIFLSYIVCNKSFSFYFKNRTSPRLCHGFEPGHDKMGARLLVLPVRTGRSVIHLVCIGARKVVNEVTSPCLLRRGVNPDVARALFELFGTLRGEVWLVQD